MNEVGLLANTVRATVPEAPFNRTRTDRCRGKTVAKDGRRRCPLATTQGVRFLKAGVVAADAGTAEPGTPGSQLARARGDVMLRTLRTILEARGGILRERATAVELVMRDTRLPSLRAQFGAHQSRQSHQCICMNFCYGHVLHRDAMINPNLRP